MITKGKLKGELVKLVLLIDSPDLSIEGAMINLRKISEGVGIAVCNEIKDKADVILEEIDNLNETLDLDRKLKKRCNK